MLFSSLLYHFFLPFVKQETFTFSFLRRFFVIIFSFGTKKIGIFTNESRFIIVIITNIQNIFIYFSYQKISAFGYF